LSIAHIFIDLTKQSGYHRYHTIGASYVWGALVGGGRWSGVMKKGKRKNPHAVALGRLGGLLQSEAKQRANKENGRKGGLVKSRKKTAAARRNARRPRPWAAQEAVNLLIQFICVRYGRLAIGRGDGAIRYRAASH
jgi:hypothetical protein